jgi:hypothetical protein
MHSSTDLRSAESPAFSRLGKLGARVMGITLLTLSLGFFVSSAHTIWSEQELLSEQLDQSGQSLANVASLSCVEFLLINDYPKLDSLVEFLAKSHPEVVFCRIERPDHTTVSEAPRSSPERVRTPENSREYTVPIVRDPEGPAQERNIQGHFVLGLSTERLLATRRDRVSALLVEGLLCFLGTATILAILLRRTVVDPVRSLDEQT